MRPYRKYFVPYKSARGFIVNRTIDNLINRIDSTIDIIKFTDTDAPFIQSHVDDVTWWQLRKFIMNTTLFQVYDTSTSKSVILKELSK